MSYFAAGLLSSFTIGVIVGVMLETSARKYFAKKNKEKND